LDVESLGDRKCMGARVITHHTNNIHEENYKENLVHVMKIELFLN